MKKPIEISIVMPCLNEKETLGKCIQKANEAFEINGLQGEVVIADNGSIDGSPDIAESMGARVVNVKEKGYGNTLRAGIESARGEYIVMGDADDSYNFIEIAPFIEKLNEGYDLVMGNRLKGGIKKGAMPFLHRYLGNPILSLMGRFFFMVPIGDFHCGMRAFTKKAYTKMELRSTGMEFATEMVVKASLKELKITEVPVILYPDGRSRKPHLRTWHDGWRHLRFLLLLAPHWLFLFPGLFLVVSSVAMSVILLYTPVHFGTITLGIHTLLYLSAFLQIGFQFIFFYVVAKTYTYYHNLLPIKSSEKRFLHIFSIEKGIVAGSAILFLGIFLTIYNFVVWKQKDFGDLDPVEFMKHVIPAVSSLFIGTQTIMCSFVLGIIRYKNNSARE